MSIGPVDIEFVVKGEIEAKLKEVGATVRGEGSAVERQLQRITASAAQSFSELGNNARGQAMAMQRVNSALEANAQNMEKLKTLYGQGSISSKKYSEAVAKLTVEHDTLQAQKAKLGRDVQREIQNNQLVAGSIAQLRQKIDELKESYNHLSATERGAEIGRQMQADIKGLAAELDKAQGAGSGFIDQLAAMPGPVGGATRSIQGMTKAALRFIATPIGAVIAAITAAIMALSSWFRRTEEGQNALARSSGYFKQVLDSLLDVVDKLGRWLYKAFTEPKKALNDLIDFMKGQVVYRFEALGKMAGAIGRMFAGEWKEGMADMFNAVAQWVSGIDDAGKKGLEFAEETIEKAKQRADIEDKLVKLRIEHRKVNEQIAESDARISELRFKARDADNGLSDRERLDMLNEAGKLIDQNYAKELDIATRRRNLVKAQKELSNSNIEDNEEVSNLNIEISRLKARQAEEQRELLRQSNTLAKAIATAVVNEMETIKHEIERLNGLLINAADEERMAIAERIVLLETELEIKQEIVNETMRAARMQVFGVAQGAAMGIGPVGNSAKQVFEGLRKEIDKNALEVEKLNEKLKKGIERAKELQKAWDAEKLEEFVNTSQDVLGITGQIVSNHREILGLNEQQAEAVDKGFQLMSGIADMASGNYLAGIYKIVDSLLTLFAREVPEAMSVAYERMRDEISKSINTIELALRTMQSVGTGNISYVIARLNNDLQSLAGSVATLQQDTSKVTYGGWFTNLLQVFGPKTSDTIARMRDDIDELTKKLAFGNLNNEQAASIKAVLESYNELVQTIDTITEQLTGTTVRTLADGLVDAFLAGEDAAAHWGQSVNDIIKNVIMKQLSAQLLQAPLQRAIDGLVGKMQDGLDPWEAWLVKNEFQGIFDEAKPAIEAVKKSLEQMGIVFTENTNKTAGLSGAIRGITEETGNMLAGQMMALRVDVKQITMTVAASIEAADRNLAYLGEIAVNSRHNYKLNSIDTRLEEMNNILKERL